jgi:phosphoribosylglycinamide formyltransferase-1
VRGGAERARLPAYTVRVKLGLLASHRGSNVGAIVDACKGGALRSQPVVLISNNSGSGAAERAQREGIPFYHLSGKTHPEPKALDDAIREALERHGAELVFLAGYMKKLGPRTLARYRGRILNTHPALLPSYGGRGMYGRHVHEAVIAAGERETGVSIHVVDAEYDTGPVVAQCRIPVEPGDTPETLAERLLEREHRFVVETLRRIEDRELPLPLG